MTRGLPALPDAALILSRLASGFMSARSPAPASLFVRLLRMTRAP